MNIVNIGNNSRLRKKILRIFFTNPDKEFYIRQLEKLINLPASNIHKELTSLVKSGVLISYKIGNIKMHKINKNYFIYEEISSIIRKTEGSEGLVRRHLSRVKNIDLVILYGDFAKKCETNDSIIELIIASKKNIPKLEHSIHQIEIRLNRKINYSFYNNPGKILKIIKKIEPYIILINNKVIG